MSKKTFTHKDIAVLLNVSETTVKSYRRKFPECIPVASQGKPIRFTEKAAEVALRIRDFFEMGMSVPEVRTRLAMEFAWISPEEPKCTGSCDKDEADATIRKVSGRGVTPELSLGVSNMAKSMVAMTQQQKAILERIRGIETVLENLGAADFVDQAGDGSEVARSREELLEARLNRLDNTTEKLAYTLQALAEHLGRFAGQRDNIALEGREKIPLAREGFHSVCEAEDGTRPKTYPAEENEEASALRPAPLSKQDERHAQNTDAHEQKTAPDPSGECEPVVAEEPSRQFFSLPLVARTEQGHYLSAGGKGRGRFCLNDLKAMLVYGFAPPNHFTLRWERHGRGWWLFLEQERSGSALQLLLMELPSRKGGNVVEILQMKKNGEVAHPAEICAVIDSLGL